MTKLKAFLIHFLLSLTVFTSVTALVAFIWYPGIYLETSGVWKALKMVAVVDVGLGPLMTLILYRKNKPGLKMDLSLVAGVQIVALIYGVWVLHSQKPALTVFHDSMFVCLNQSHIDYSGAPLNRFKAGKSGIPVAILPQLQGEMIEDWRHRSTRLPKGYPVHPAFVYGDKIIAYGPDNLAMVLAEEWDLSRELEINPKSAEIWEKYQQEFGTDAPHAFFPLTCGLKQY
ncbi:MAG: hypothetical protein OQK12_07980, partial [Motiliproteus sp.]|nr:hypothetical protein [Motiliproteus sp.]